MTQEINLLLNKSILNFPQNFPTHLMIKILSFIEKKDHFSLAGVNRNLNSIINKIASCSLEMLRNQISSSNTKSLYLTSDKSPLCLFFRIFFDLRKEISSTRQGNQFLNALQIKPNIFDPFISCVIAKQMIEWIRAKNFIVFCEVLQISALNSLLANITHTNLLEKKEELKTWILNTENQHFLSDIRQFDLLREELSEIPPEIGQLTGLQKLWIQNDRFSNLPKEIGQLTALQELNLEENRLTFLPTEIGQLTALRKLYLDYNQISFLPTEIGQLTALRLLCLRSNGLASLPPEIGQLTTLEGLDLSNNLYPCLNKLTSLPVEIGQLTALQWLDLNYNKLTSLPVEICKLTALQELNLRHNKLTSLPVEIGQLTSLEILDLKDNLLTILPREIYLLPNLKNCPLGNSVFQKAIYMSTRLRLHLFKK